MGDRSPVYFALYNLNPTQRVSGFGANTGPMFAT